MKPTSEILERIARSSAEHKNGVFTRLYRYLLREEIYYAAYQNLYANKLKTENLDETIKHELSKLNVEELIEGLRSGMYKPAPTKYEYIQKRDGKVNLIGLPSIRDKLLQEAVRMILEAIYEPTFNNCSHGFRRKKNPHTALKQISSDFTGVVWFINGNASGCLDRIDHEVLIHILSKKIKDSKFLNVIRQFLKVGYVENWKYGKTYSNAPLGGIISPILANIFLNELDTKLSEMKEDFDKPRISKHEKTPRYREIDNEMKRISYWIDHTEDTAERQTLIDQYKSLQKELHKIPCHPQTNKKITFVRYADDWLVGVCGTKEECLAIKTEIADFLNEELKITSNKEIQIVHSSEKVRFIGYDICVRRNQELKGFKMKNGNWRQSRSLHLKVALTIPHTEKIEKFMFEKKAIVQTNGGSLKFKPMHRTALLNLSDIEIVDQYNSEMRGLLNYYNQAVDYHTLNYFCYLMEYSCLKTIANKHKTSVRKIVNQYKDGNTWSIPYVIEKETKRMRPVKIADCKNGKVNDIVFQRTNFSWKTTIRQKFNAGICELCGKPCANLCETTTIGNAKELGNSDLRLATKTKHRKTIVICSDCYKEIHK